MDLRGGSEQQRDDVQWIDFSYAVATLSIDVVENIITRHPRLVNQPGISTQISVIRLRLSIQQSTQCSSFGSRNVLSLFQPREHGVIE